jgi:chitodextrinase
MRSGAHRFAVLLTAVVACRDEPGSAGPRLVQPAPPPADRATDAGAPTVPTDVEARTLSASGVELTWTRSADDTGVSGYEIEEKGFVVARTPGRTVTVEGLSPGGEHCYSVFALDTSGNRSGPGGPACVSTPDTVPPAAPWGLVARLVGTTQASLGWRPSEDDVAVARYEVLRGGRLVATAEGLSAADSRLSPGANHCYEVVAVDGAGNRSPPSAQACIVAPDVTPPSAPAASARPASDRSVAVAWGAASDDAGVAGYELLREERLVAHTGGLSASEAGLEPGRRYCYAVVAIDRAGNRSAPSAPACAMTPDLTPPSPPARVLARPWGEHEIAVGWEEATDDVGVERYELLRDGKVIAVSVERSAADGGLAPWTDHCYQVCALDAAGNRSRPAGPACARTQDLTPPATPADLEAKPANDRAVSVRWKVPADNVGIAGYEVVRDGEVVARADQPTAAERELLPARRYCYAVRALDPAGNRSETSAPVCTVTPDLLPPTAPGHLAVAANAPTRLALAWEPSRDDVGVVAYEILSGDEVVATSTRSWTTVDGLAPEAEHCLGVRAYDAAGNRSPVAGPSCDRTPDAAAPAGPVNLRAEPVSKGVLRLRWDPSPQDGMLYAVYRDEDRRVGMTRSSSYTVAGLGAGERRCYRVAAVNPAGRESPRTIPVCGAAPGAVSAR